MVENNQRFEPASPGWIAALRQFLTREFTDEDMAGVTSSVSWEITEPPAHLLQDGMDTIGFGIRIAGGQVEVLDHPLQNAETSIRMPYDAQLQSFRLNNENEAEFVREVLPKLLAEGKVALAGAPGAVQKLFIKYNVRERFFNVYTI